MGYAGVVIDDQRYTYNCISGKERCAKGVHTLTYQQGQMAKKYIEDIKFACNQRDSSKCHYRLIGHNCVDFVTDVVKAAGIQNNWFEHLEVDQGNFNIWDKAWNYIFAKSGGSVSLFWGRSTKIPY